MIAENILTKTPMPSVKANPFTKLEVKKYRIAAVIKVEEFESRMDGQARRKPSSTAAAFDKPFLISSFVLSKMRILASTAMPIDKIFQTAPQWPLPHCLNLKTVRHGGRFFCQPGNPGRSEAEPGKGVIKNDSISCEFSA